MSLVADALQSQVVRGLMSLSGRVPDLALSEALTTTKAGYDLAFGKGTISIDFRKPEFLTSIIAGDCSRLVSASLQTFSLVPKEIIQKDTMAWSLVKLYYSAFYAGHAVVRLFGQSCSYFDRKLVNQIAAFGALTGATPSFDITSGLYRCVIGASAGGLEATGLGGNSPHETFWKMFGIWIEDAQLKISRFPGSLGPNDAQAVILKFENLKDVTGRGRLSTVRNELQYRHKFGVWLPVRLSSSDRQALGRLVSQWKRDPMTIDLHVPAVGALGEFVIGCTFLIALCRTVVERIVERSTVGRRSFVNFGLAALLERVRG